MGNKQSQSQSSRRKAVLQQSSHPPLTQRALLDAIDYSAASYDHRCGPYQWMTTGGYSLRLPETGFCEGYIATSISGYLLGSQPHPFSLYLNCVSCGKSCYDGGLCKIVICSCGILQQRDCEDRVVIADAQEQSLSKSMFIRTNEVPQPYNDLQTLTLGLFVDSPDQQVNFDFVLIRTLLPYFSQRQRCVAKGDMFSVGAQKFKVMACYPSAGLVNAGTQMQCYTPLHLRPLSRVHILPIRPSTLDERVVNRKVLPFMQENTVHLHKEQTFQIDGVKLIVMAAEPLDGIVTNSTELFFAGEPLATVKYVSILAHAENVPASLVRLSREQLKDAVYHMFLMPFFVGWNRIIQPNQQINIEGMQLTLQTSHTGLGVIADTSKLMFDGSLVQRSMPALLSQSLQSILGVRSNIPRSSGDPRVDLLQHIIFIQQLLSSIELRDDNEIPAGLLEQLPVHRLTSIPTSEDRKRCMICIEDYEIGVEVKTMPCCKC